MIARAAQHFEVDPRRVAAVLVDPEAIERWSPVPFRVTGHNGDRLNAGHRLTVEGALAGRRLRFEVHIARADETGLTLRATGPFDVEASYAIEPESSCVSARVETSGAGLRGRMFASAANTFLSAGILDDALARLVDEANQPAPRRAARTARTGRTGRTAARVPATA